MRKVVVGVFVVLGLIGVMSGNRWPNASAAATGGQALSYIRWEYGVYRVGGGKHNYEWQDNTRRVFTTKQKPSVFLEKMGLSRIKALDKINTEESAPYDEYVVTQGLINELGQQGWEFFEIERDTGREIYRFKRRLN